MIRHVIWGAVIGLVGAALSGKSSYEPGWSSLVQGGGVGFALGFAAAYAVTVLRKKRKKD